MPTLSERLRDLVRAARRGVDAEGTSQGGVPDPGRRGSLSNLTALGMGGTLWALNHGVAMAAQEGTGPPAAAAGEDRLNIRAFGARGDRRTDDFDAIRRAIARASAHDQYPASVFIPAGHYRRRDSIALPSHSCLFGEGVSSILNSQHDDGFARPILVNADSYGLVSTRLQDLSLYGGSHGLRLEAQEENADIRLQNVTMLLQRDANIEANKLFQTAKIVNCVFGDAPYGIKVLGSGTNCLIATGSEWVRHTQASILLRGADGVTIVGGRFEEGGVADRYCLDIEKASNILFLGCFFENVHEYLGRFREITGAVVFQSCHFTGTRLGGAQLRPFRWDTADTLLMFRDCVAVTPMSIPGHVMLEGANHGITATQALYEGSGQSGHLVVPPRPRPDRGPVVIATVTAPGPWRLRMRLSLLPEPGRGSVAEMTVSDTSEAVANDAAFDVRLVRRAGGQCALSVAVKDATIARLGWTLGWTALGENVPTVRAVLA